MSVCTFIASDYPLTEIEPSQDYPLDIHIDDGTVHDGGADETIACTPLQMLRTIPKRETLSIWNGIIPMAEPSK